MPVPTSAQKTPTSTGWALPGPSSKFHIREKSRPKPAQPSPFDWRARSRLSYCTSTYREYDGTPYTPTSEKSYIPAPVRRPRPRPSSISSSPLMASSSEHSVPLTPVRSPHYYHNSAAGLYDSPFSDYFTDEARSVDNYNISKPAFAQPSSEAQRLLLRLNSLGSEILRNDPSPETAQSLRAKLDELEAILVTPTKNTPRRGSAFYSEREEDDDESRTGEERGEDLEETSTTPQGHNGQDQDQDQESVPKAVHAKIRNQARLLREAQEVLSRVSHAHDSLRLRYDEVRRLNDAHVDQLEDSGRELMTLKSENETLKADLGFDHSELLFLKLQLRALEVQADLDDDEKKRDGVLNDDIERWRCDWDDVDTRLRSRREKHGVVSATPPSSSHGPGSSNKEGKKPMLTSHGDWKLDMCRRKHGRVQSIIIRRRLSNASQGSNDDDMTLVEDSDDVARLVSKADYRETSTQTDAVAVFEEAAVSAAAAEESVEESSVSTPPRSAWQELCDGLTAFAGMSGRDDDSS